MNQSTGAPQSNYARLTAAAGARLGLDVVLVLAAAGYAGAARDLLEQVPGLEHVAVSAESGGTMAGLVSVLGADRVLGVSCGAVPDARASITALLAEMGCPTEPDDLRIDTGQVGRGYQHICDTTRSAMQLAARTEGLAVDATYVGRAVAGLVTAASEGSIRPGEPTVLMHTGGPPGLFGHPEIG